MVPSAGAVSGTADGRTEQYLPLPLQANKQHMSPQPTQSMMYGNGSSTSLLGDGGTSSSVNVRGQIPSLTISTSSGVETFDQGQRMAGSTSPSALSASRGMVAGGSVDLSSFRPSDGDDEFGYEPEPATATRSQFTITDDHHHPSGHRPRESFDEAAWEGMDGNAGAFEGDEGQAGPGPSTIRALNATATS